MCRRWTIKPRSRGCIRSPPRTRPISPASSSSTKPRFAFRGSVRFVDAHGQPAQPMQGVNVVARWIDPSTGQPSRQYVAASVSGFLFAGNVGNPATGFNDSTGQPFNRFGSDDPTVEGSFDLAGLQIPNGASSAPVPTQRGGD